MNDEKDIYSAFNDHFIKSSFLFNKLSGMDESLEAQDNVSITISEEEMALSPRKVSFLLDQLTALKFSLLCVILST